ncbi:MAG TPA: coenzyme F420-0:L-glutamate ligase [Sphingomonas sp.]|nr:coenzyme F420-0:L-glutamate ligase [Sphingomonas sp.]
MIEIIPLTGIGEVHPGDDLAELLAEAIAATGLAPGDGDVLVVTQKIVSKAENRFVRVDEVIPGAEAERLAAITGKPPTFVELVLRESSAVLRAVPNVLIARHRTGHVMANAGIDHSNIGDGRSESVLLLPLDSDASAQAIRAGLATRWHPAPAVLISDSFGRPWRMGVTNVAIGASGLPSLVDRRGDLDRDGRSLEVTQVALGDMLASAAGLAMGEGAEGVPAVLVRGVSWREPDAPASALVRPIEQDLFQ